MVVTFRAYVLCYCALEFNTHLYSVSKTKRYKFLNHMDMTQLLVTV